MVLRTVATLYLVVLISILSWMATTWSDLPDSLPMHFGDNMQPDRMAPAKQVFWLYFLLILFQAGFFVTLIIVIRWLPVSLINIPHRKYWLSGDRRAASLRWLSTMLLIVGVTVQLFMASLYFLTLRVGRGAAKDIYPEFLWLMGLFLFVVFGAVACSFRRFRRPRGLDDHLDRATG